MNKQDFPAYLEETWKMLLNAGMSYRIWWVFRNSKDAPIWNDTVNELPAFFAPTVRSHLVTFIISLGILFDTRKEAISFPKLMILAKKDARVSSRALKKAEQKLAKIDLIAKKVLFQRNNLFAHLNANIDRYEVFKHAPITPNQYKNLIRDGLILLNILSREIQGVVYTDDFDEVERETRKLLETLKTIVDRGRE